MSARSVLLVEDDAGVRGLVRAALESGGYVVTEAECGQAAVDICRRGKQRFDLLLTDIMMPGMKGWEVAVEVRRLHPRIRVVFMTGYADAEALGQCGECPVLQKPFACAGLLDLLARIF